MTTLNNSGPFKFREQDLLIANTHPITIIVSRPFEMHEEAKHTVA